MSHKCKAILIRCIDFRLEPVMEEFLAHNELISDCDVISVAGAGKDLVDNPDYLLQQIKISVDLHETSDLHLIHHTDCGAYGGSGSFESKTDEIDLHKEEMKKATAVLKQKFKNLNIKNYIAELKNNKFSIKEIK